MKILVVDDNEGFLNIMGDLLRDFGNEVLLAEDGKVARELLETERVDLIVSDVFMPTLDGNRFHSYVREFLGDNKVPFIFYSGYNADQTDKSDFDPNVDFFLSKSGPIDEIVSLIENIKTSRQAKGA